jgi:hypothetical protein
MEGKNVRILTTLTFVLSLLVLTAAPTLGQGGECPLWGVTGVWDSPEGFSGRSEVFKVDAVTGLVTMVNNSVTNPLYGDIAMTPGGALYAVGADDFTQAPNDWWVINFNDFYRLDPVTGDVLQMWPNVFTDGGFERINALNAVNNATLLAVEGGGVCDGWGYTERPRLLQIHLDGAGNFVSISNMGYIAAAGAESVCSDGDLDLNPLTGLWYAGFWADAGSEMLELNLADPPNSTLVSQSGIQWQGGFAFCPDGTAYAGSWADEVLYSVDVPVGGNAVAHDLGDFLAGAIYGLSSEPGGEDEDDDNDDEDDDEDVKRFRAVRMLKHR